jgi:hypothetical protein
VSVERIINEMSRKTCKYITNGAAAFSSSHLAESLVSINFNHLFLTRSGKSEKKSKTNKSKETYFPDENTYKEFSNWAGLSVELQRKLQLYK